MALGLPQKKHLPYHRINLSIANINHKIMLKR